MSRYEYKCIEGPSVVLGQQGKDTHSKAIAIYQDAINEQASEGWEFIQIDEILSTLKPGCLGIFGSTQTIRLKLLIFRREINS